MSSADARSCGWRRTGAVAAVLLALGAVTCGDGVDVRQALRVTDVVTGWYDEGIVGGKNKLVPTISFRVKNTADRPIAYVQLNSVFRVIGDEEELGSMLVKGIGGEGLAAGTTSETWVMKSALGYTGEQPRHEMLDHRQFRDAKVELFAKHGSEQWVKIGEYPIARQLLTR
jgi:hypothetical protein